MFKELLPLLVTRGLVLTVGMVKNDAIRVTITPRPKDKDEAKQVIQPFVVEGTAEELDAELPRAIETYAAAIMTLERSLAELKANTEAVIKEAKAESDKKIADAKKKPGAAAKTAVTKQEPPKPPEPPSLFDAPSQASAEVQPDDTTPAVVDAVETPSDDSDDDPNGPGNSDDSDESDESGNQSEEETSLVNVPATLSVASPSAQPDMFDQTNFNEEEEVLKEAFSGAEDNLIAA